MDDTEQTPNAPAEAMPPANEAAKADVGKPADEPAKTQNSTAAELSAALVDAENAAHEAAKAVETEALPLGSKLAVQGVLSKLESEFETEWSKGTTSFKNWYHAILAELKAHLKL